MNQKRKLESTVLKGILLTTFILSSCDTADDSIKQEQSLTSKGEIKKGTFLGEEITYLRKDGKNIFQGDMLITDEQLNENLQSRAAVVQRLRWPNNTVYYTFSPHTILYNKSLLNRVNAAIREYNTKTNVKWVYRSGYNSSIVTFDDNGMKGNGGAATIGMQPGLKLISLNSNASFGTIIHEMGHTIGLHHEQSRKDRDNYITINWHNIIEEYRYNFEKHDGVDIGSFDINSVMMYHDNAFAKSFFLKTIVLKNGKGYTANNSGFSQSDINAINIMYPRK